MNRWKRIVTMVTMIALVVSLSACQTVSEHRTATGAVAGTALGAGAGALIDKDNPYRGALIGAAAGALVGTGIGHVLQKQKQAFDRIEGLEARQQTVILQQPPQFSDDGMTRQPRESKPVESLMLRVPNEVLFEKGSSALSAQGAQKLREMAKVLQEYPDSDVYIRGYTSSEGDDRTNFELSQRRAEVVKGELAAAGVIPSRLYVQGMGSSSPIASKEA